MNIHTQIRVGFLMDIFFQDINRHGKPATKCTVGVISAQQNFHEPPIDLSVIVEFLRPLVFRHPVTPTTIFAQQSLCKVKTDQGKMVFTDKGISKNQAFW